MARGHLEFPYQPLCGQFHALPGCRSLQLTSGFLTREFGCKLLLTWCVCSGEEGPGLLSPPSPLLSLNEGVKRDDFGSPFQLQTMEKQVYCPSKS